MYRRTDRQSSLFSAGHLLPEEKREAVAKSWAGPFREKILPLLLKHEDDFAVLFHADNGRPNKSVALVVGSLVLKEVRDLTDDEVIGSMDFDSRWWYAFDVEASEAHVCQKTLHNFRVALIKHQKARLIFRMLTDELIPALGIETSKQRLDSTHILSNIAKLTRLGVFTETLRVFLQALKKQDAALYGRVPARILMRHGPGAVDYGDARQDDRPRRIAVAARDTYRLVEFFKGDKAVEGMEEYVLLQRLLAERCEILPATESSKGDDDDRGEPPVPVRALNPEEVESDALQTPHDPEVTYSGHKGQGYEAQISETCQDKDTPQDKRNPVQLITEVKLTPSAKSDARQTIPMIEALEAAGHKPDTALADTTYSGAENAAKAAQHHVDLLAPCPAKGKPDPQKTYPAPAAHCPETKAEAAEWLKQQEASPDFKKKYALRSGIEGTNSEWKRGQGAGRLRVRGGQRVELAVHLKATALNLKRALNYWLTAPTISDPIPLPA